MATLPTQDSPDSTPRVFSPRSPWFWLISGLGTLALAVIIIVVLTVTSVLPDRAIPRRPPVLRDRANVEAPPPRDVEVPPGERQRVIQAKLDDVKARLKELDLNRQQTRAALAVASTSHGGNVEAGILRADLAAVDALWRRLNAERDRLNAELRGS